MKNLRLAIFVVGTTMMLWLGCSTYTASDTALKQQSDHSLVETEFYAQNTGDSLAGNAGAFDELDEVE